MVDTCLGEEEWKVDATLPRVSGGSEESIGEAPGVSRRAGGPWSRGWEPREKGVTGHAGAECSRPKGAET